MALYGKDDDDVPSSANVLDNEDVMGSLVKSLISSQGLQSAWQAIGRRVKTNEVELNKNSAFIAKMPEAYVPRGEFIALVTEGQGSQLRTHEERLGQLDELLKTLSKVVNKDHQGELDKIMANSVKLTTSAEKAVVRADQVEREGAQQRDAVNRSLSIMRDEFNQHIQGGIVSMPQVMEVLKNAEDAIRADMAALEERAKQYTDKAIESAFTDLCASCVRDDAPPYQAQLFKVVQKTLVTPVRKDLTKASEQLEELRQQVERTKEDVSAESKRSEKVSQNLRNALNIMFKELKEELDGRANQEDMKEMDTRIGTNMGELNKQVEDLTESTVRKLSEFVDHFSKLHETLDDHEHCLRHHAEEMENRGTKYDLLVCRSQIDRCANKDEMFRELNEVKKAITWQSSKLEGLSGLAGGGGPSRRKTRRMQTLSAAHSTAHSAAGSRMGSRAGSPGDTVEAPSTAGGSTKPGTREAQKQAGASTPTATAPPPAAAPPAVAAAAPATHTAPAAAASTPAGDEKTSDVPAATVSGSAPAGTRESTKEEEATAERSGPGRPDIPEVSAAPMENDPLSMMAGLFQNGDDDFDFDSSSWGEQLEALSAGVVGLAYLTLRDCRHADVRFALTELLEELHILRKWVAKGVHPPGWSSQKLDSFAQAFVNLLPLRKKFVQSSQKAAEEVHKALHGSASEDSLWGSKSAKAKKLMPFQQPMSARSPKAAMANTLPPVTAIRSLAS
eukprot:TRINITY_DN21164_c0_g1_i1.p1 TRINITY_DN21164_c0_g1~~TRINITY_DN21164_c0_g1_i1.p1  ORF type:complete len:731 (-),score=226.98 TRINITY_DN21164_c0_g1_i1:70-2262(-)